MNAVRDNLTFLKGALDLLTNATAADTGTATYLSVTRTASTDVALQSRVTADAAYRFAVTAEGDLEWGAGAVSRTVRLQYGAAGTVQFDSIGSANPTLVRAEATAGQTASIAARLAGDSVDRATLRGDAVTGVQLGSGSAVDMVWRRQAAGVSVFDANSGSTATNVVVQATAGQFSMLDLLVAGDSTPRLRLRGDATIYGFQSSTGSAAIDASFIRGGASGLAYWTSDVPIAARAGIATFSKAGAPVDADFPTGVIGNGIIAIDTTNLYIYVRIGGVWKRTAALV